MKKCLLLFLALFLSGCDSGTEWRDEKYEIIWIDTLGLSLNLNVGASGFVERVPPNVVAVGSNSQYIVVKQSNKASKEIAYFYLEKGKDNTYKNANEITKGPLGEAEFIELSRKLGLPKITKEFHY
ncbi:hypothetical protein [Cellvibrio sp. BR]|uniref:hypothetical protein n=1 Tax=Cellvibrio sp. BR TaxID=1134474 RepID=UPI00058E8212|nr:hypothetical protein [Cellvibrio sp. BR]